MRLPLVLGKKTGSSGIPQDSAERIVNGYVTSVPDGKEPAPVIGTPGSVLWATGLNGPIRGMVEMSGAEYAVAGMKLYAVAVNGQATEIGTIPGADDVAMAVDGTNVVIVTGGSIYVYNGSTCAKVTDPDAPSASSVVWVDGYFLFGETGTQVFFISALSDPLNYDALDYAAAEWKPDLLVTPVMLRRTVYLFGQKTIEAQQNTGAALFPFSRYQDILIDVGVVGRDAVSATNDTMFWIANDLTARRLDGLTATVISTAPINKLIKAWADASKTIASAHVWDDHLFIVFRNPDGCVVFDQTTQLWHERASFQSPTWRVAHFSECYGLKLFGSATEGKIYALDADAYDEDGAVVPFLMTTPYAYFQNKRLTVTEVEIVAEVGVGTLTLDPEITLERTFDGVTFSTRKARTLGKAGERGKRVLFGPQGQGRAMAWRIGITDPVKRSILAAYVEADVEI